MNKKFKFLTVLLALVMTLGAFAPFSARAEEEGEKEGTKKEATETTKTVTLHKLVMSKEDLGKWDTDAIEKKGYNGTQDTDALKALLDAGHSAKEVAGVYFAVKDSDGKYVTIKTDTKEEAKPTYGKVDSLDAELPDGFELLAGETTATGIEFKTAGLNGEYTIVEVHEKSTYVGENGEAITDSKAVPVEITLPLVNNAGVVVNAHVYPKNTEDKPQIDKNFAKEHKLEEVDNENNPTFNEGAKYENSNKEKATAKVNVGDTVPYEVKTKIPKAAKYKKLVWTDEMTKGLTYNKGTLEVNGAGLTKDDYILLETEKGFTLNIKESGLAKIENAAKNGEVEITLTYSATVNKTAVPDKTDENHVKLEYYNTPGFTPSEVTPKDQKIEVVKNWATDGNQAVTDADKKAVIGYTLQEKIVKENDEIEWKDVETVVKTYNEEARENSFNHTFTGLDDNKTYRVVETVMGYDPEYKTEENGKVKIVNKKTEKPNVLEPTDPKVITGGKKFVKTNQDGTERLAGAEFYVKNAEGKYLVHSSIVENANNKKELDDAKDKRDKAYEDYNNMTKADQEGEAGKQKKEEMKTLQEKYEELLNKYSDSYTWGSKDDKHVVILTSNAKGQFEITGLKYGTYYLEEKEAPKDYAKLSKDVEFVVKEGSYNGQPEGVDHKHIGYDSDTDTIKGQQITNKKVSIPQTGGIGTVIFTVVGVMLMVGAAFALKRRKEDELEGLA